MINKLHQKRIEKRIRNNHQIIEDLEKGIEHSATVPSFIDAEKRNKMNPDSFYIPSAEERNNVDADWLVKVIYNNERFWVQVVDAFMDGTKKLYAGIVDNILINSADINYLSLVIVEPKHIIEIADIETLKMRDAGVLDQICQPFDAK